ncbi:hypothetical protein QLX08_005941 [Tetragonisca angustula]|uniref:Uncharacterized protein n=1 Tax=Tetragonisca angustula TaxID=166442 RepID=A0AAW0ZVX8_9HYME
MDTEPEMPPIQLKISRSGTQYTAQDITNVTKNTPEMSTGLPTHSAQMPINTVLSTHLVQNKKRKILPSKEIINTYTQILTQ